MQKCMEAARDLVPLTCVLSYDHVVCDYVMQITGSTKNGVNHTWFVENIFLVIVHYRSTKVFSDFIDDS